MTWSSSEKITFNLHLTFILFKFVDRLFLFTFNPTIFEKLFR